MALAPSTVRRDGEGVDSDLLSGGLGLLVAQHPGWVSVLDYYGIDYFCCGGDTLGQAGAAMGADLDRLVADLESCSDTGFCPTLVGASLGDMRVHLLGHHRFLTAELPRLTALIDTALANTVEATDRYQQRQLLDVSGTFAALRRDLEAHLRSEERDVYTLCVDSADRPRLVDGLRRIVQRLKVDHESTGERLVALDELTGGFAAPVDAHRSYAVMNGRLMSLVAEVRRQVHEENNLLFPAVLARYAANTPEKLS